MDKVGTVSIDVSQLASDLPFALPRATISPLEYENLISDTSNQVEHRQQQTTS